jgi:carboxyl-terminal processing protease
MKLLKISLVVVLLASVVGTAFSAGYVAAISSGGAPAPASARALFGDRTPGASGAATADAPRQFAVLNDIWRVLRQDFVDPNAVDADKLGKGAIDGMIAALDDRHTHYLDVETRRMEDSQMRGSYEGIGAHVQMDEGVLTIIAPIAGSPAEAAGVRAGDKILAIDGVVSQGMNLNDAVNKVKGPRGTKVTLTIQRAGSAATFPLEITRDEIKTASVALEMQPDGLARIQIAQFGQRTTDEMRDALQNARRQNAKGLLLDLRNNPGGLLDATVDITNMFLDGGLAGYQVDRDGRRTTLPLRGRGDFTDIPMVVLVNGGSASGSELLAGALQDRGRAKLVGATTYGKGSVNHLRELPDGSALYVTIGRWLTPNGRLIEGNGLTPDYPVSLSEDDIRAKRDLQLEKAQELLRGATGR